MSKYHFCASRFVQTKLELVTQHNQTIEPYLHTPSPNPSLSMTSDMCGTSTCDSIPTNNLQQRNADLQTRFLQDRMISSRDCTRIRGSLHLSSASPLMNMLAPKRLDSIMKRYFCQYRPTRLLTYKITPRSYLYPP